MRKENENTIIGFESKFLETSEETEAKFSENYFGLDYLDKFWFDIMKKYQGKKQLLDVAQLIKHSFGLINYGIEKKLQVNLVYLYWLPKNFNDVEVCKKHVKELEKFKNELRRQEQISFMTIQTSNNMIY